MDLSILRSVRNFLGLRLADVERATGVRSTRLSQAERGLGPLTRGEFIAVRDFLRERLADDVRDGNLLLLSRLGNADCADTSFPERSDE
jgi:transcriptional regulator with XRE-family HTH domain